MKTLTADALLQALAAGEIEPLYVFCGPLSKGRTRAGSAWPEKYLQRQAVKALIEQALDPDTRPFNLSAISLPESTLARVVDAARQLPVFSARRVLLVRDLDKAFKRGGGPEEGGTQPIAESSGAKELIEYLKHPSESTTVVFFYDKPDRRLTLTTALLKACTIVQFTPLSEKDAASWALKYLRDGACTMDEATLGLLIGRVGTELERLLNELEKLMTYVGQGPITRADVDSLVPHLKEHSNFELSHHLLARDRLRALKLLRRQLEAGQKPVMLLGLIASLYRRMMLAKDLMAHGAPNNDIAKAIGMPSYLVGRFNEQVRRTPLEDIYYGIKRVAEVDRAIKSSLGPPVLQLEHLVHDLCRRRIPTSG